MLSGGVPHGAVVLQVPASSANLGPGFDSIGLALALFDEIEAIVAPDGGLRIEVTGEGAGSIPRDERHLVWRSACRLWERLGIEPPSGLILKCHNRIPQSRGLGSSAAAIVAGVALAYTLTRGEPDPLQDPQARQLLGDVAGDQEGHPDNSSASVFGGFTVSWRDEQRAGWNTVTPRLHPQVAAAVYIPRDTLATHSARAALPAQVDLPDAASAAGRAALLVHAMTTEPGLLLPATRDWLHQEPRRSAYPASMELVDQLRAQGLAATISGAGPSVLVLHRQDTPMPAPRNGWRLFTEGIGIDGVRVVSRDPAHTV